MRVVASVTDYQLGGCFECLLNTESGRSGKSKISQLSAISGSQREGSCYMLSFHFFEGVCGLTAIFI